VRSFFFVAHYAESNGFTKIVHLEADAFLVSEKAIALVNCLDEGWSAPWCRRFRRPESGIQIIAGSALRTYQAWADRPISSFDGSTIEKTLPFTHIFHDLRGDRYGEGGGLVPSDADWCMQARPDSDTPYTRYFWWLNWFTAVFPELGVDRMPAELIVKPSTKLEHRGAGYLQWLQSATRALRPKMYFEIGTHAGDSLRLIECDAVCVDPKFTVSSNVIRNRRNTHFFQGTSDEFFSDQASVTRLLPNGVDFAFLDGLHKFEYLLRDFIYTERLANPHAVFVLHDCLPLNIRMTAREQNSGPENEAEHVRRFWTGDVWKLLPILREYRPDLTVGIMNCPPTGLVVCANLDRKNSVLEDRYDEIVTRFLSLDIAEYGLERLWDLFPTYDSVNMLSNTELLLDAVYHTEKKRMPSC
jgi:hypothetical protein